MKKFGIILLVAAVVLVAVVAQEKKNAPGKDLEVEYYFRALDLPIWTPLSRGYMPGDKMNPTYLELSNMRYLVIIVSMPARLLLELEEKQPERPDEQAGNMPSEQQQKPDEGLKESLDSWELSTQSQGQEEYVDNRIYPKFNLVLENGKIRRARAVVAWPRKGECVRPEHFQDKSDWHAKPGDKSNKRYRLAIFWRSTKKDAIGPFNLQMDDREPIEVPQDKHTIFNKW